MGFVVISDHDRICHLLRNGLILMISDSEDDPKVKLARMERSIKSNILKSSLFLLMATIARDSHGNLNLQGVFREYMVIEWAIRPRHISHFRRRGMLPFSNFLRVEDDNSFAFILLPQLLFLYILRLFPSSSFPFPFDTALAYLNRATIQGLVLVFLRSGCIA